jgi:hypothetical protein
LDTNLEYFDNSVTSILFETEPGCKKTDFKFTDEYYKINTQLNNCFIASDFNEFENTINKYFEMDYFKTINQEYFDKNIMIIIVLSADDGEYFKNGIFLKGNDNKFVYYINLWNSGKPILLRNKCSYIKVYIINMEKINEKL